MQKKQLICICLNKIDWDKRVIGYLTSKPSSSTIDLQVIDEKGNFKMRKQILIETIKSIEIGGIYNDNLEKLAKAQLKPSKGQMKQVTTSKGNIQLLQRLKDSQQVCTFFFETEYAVGKVRKLSICHLVINNITFDGRNDGLSIFDITSLTKIRIGSSKENRISLLHGDV